jgi:glyoxylase-like metal-dependent hydrolase (beta-lactamase superfamily II)
MNNNNNNNNNHVVDDDNDNGWFYLGTELREFRHNPCLMRPVSLVMIVLFAAFMLITLALQLPALVLGLILAPLLQRSAWYVEFLYPLPLGRWGHFFLMGLSSKLKTSQKMDKNRGFHSRTLEQRYEVVKDRVYLHPLPQWIDNVGYLLVCLPEVSQSERIQDSLVRVEDKTVPILGLVIDCGQCDAVVRAVELIQDFHYDKTPIRLESILSTHKHHDHTGGNHDLMKHEMGRHIRYVGGGAVEKVPGCTDGLADGQIVPLPKADGNDMNGLVEMEVIGVPAHTRGSLIYRLRTTKGGAGQPVEYVFTGDTMFSGGAGVSFEADNASDSESRLNKANGNTFIRGTNGTAAMERCFSEVLSRSMPHDQSNDVCDRILIFPGHDYTQELLKRQFQTPALESCKWKNFPPRDFFETASHLYLSIHRKSLPHNSGRLLMLPSSLGREIHINTHFRALRRSAELVVRAVVFWHNNFYKNKPNEVVLFNNDENGTSHRRQQGLEPSKTPASAKKWNLDANDVAQSVFTTVYTEDLEAILEDLGSGRISKKDALGQLRTMNEKLNTPVVNKRAIPGFLPSDKSIYKGICGLTLLGSKLTALTVSDSRQMNMPPPLDYNSDMTLVSESRLVTVLRRLKMLQTSEGEDVSIMIKRLWEEANEYCSPQRKKVSYNHGDVESSHWHDQVEIGMLKWIMYGVSANQPSWFSKLFCMPCSNVPTEPFVFPDHPAQKMNQRSGDLVSHDVLSCYLCRNATGSERTTSVSDTPKQQVDDVGIETLRTKTLPKETVSFDSLEGIDPPEGEIEIATSFMKEHSIKTNLDP